jgi:translation initiation factor IF-2
MPWKACWPQRQQEVVVANAEVRMVFNITKVGTIAGCADDGRHPEPQNHGAVKCNGIVLHRRNYAKRFKDDESEVPATSAVVFHHISTN